ncbi:PF11146 family protein [Leptospira kirschneri str. 200803703]|uniref:DUF2905 domain-containing protein n=1 Tax=Leptospira kirschneri TaxID=29507 RepID=UPI0002BD46D9|nr:DUF2905 domain-containing protein [Leptospira kirschneri]EMO69407.1 PF11146 family protein [Leptospira kirschneri str. 200803703]
MENFAKTFLILGVLFLLVGLFILYGNKFPFLNYLGKLPGDIRIERENFKFYFPLTTSILEPVSKLVVLLNRNYLLVKWTNIIQRYRMDFGNK